MKFDDMLYGMTTIIEAHIGPYKSQGSGFFYNALGEPTGQSVEGGTGWRLLVLGWLLIGMLHCLR